MNTPKPALRVLLVCMGNICRSPTAEVVLRDFVTKAGLGVHLDSAGTEGYHIGAPPDHRSIRHAKKRGYDLSTLRARQIRAEDFTSFDLILAADPANLAELKRRCPASQHDKLALFLGDAPLPDPYYGETTDFENVLDLIEARSEWWVRHWQAS